MEPPTKASREVAPTPKVAAAVSEDITFKVTGSGIFEMFDHHWDKTKADMGMSHASYEYFFSFKDKIVSDYDSMYMFLEPVDFQ